MAGPSFNQQFEQFSQWRNGFADRLAALYSWLAAQDLLDTAVQEQVRRLAQQVREDRVRMAFVAEFSRGKSELINAVFFAQYGRRIMPASPGRTTMCPTELSYDAAQPVSLHLLPIATRLQARSLAEWREDLPTWHRVPLDVGNPEQLAQAMAQVARVRAVTVADARRLGFWEEGAPDNPPLDAQGMVEVPYWRHAVVNLDHPLLRQGLVIVDTPGLNAVGSEPELTVNLIAQAHAIVFLLAADTGVTQSDLAMWRQHLLPSHRQGSSHLVVLNKADTLWDGMTPQAQLLAQLQRQRAECARVLGVSPERVLPLSAQKGLMAKITGQDAQLPATGLPALEAMLAQSIVSHRQHILRAAVGDGIAHLQAQVQRALHIRRSDVQDQVQELRSLRGKNQAVIGKMRQRIEEEQRSFDSGHARIHAVRAVHLRMLNAAFKHLGATALRTEMAQLQAALATSGLKLGVRRVYEDLFARLQGQAAKVQVAAVEIQDMLGHAFRQLNTEFGFALQVPPAFQLDGFDRDLALVQESYLQYVGIGQSLRLADPQVGQRLIQALGMRLRLVFDGAVNDLDLWSRSATAALDAQCRERKRSLERRMEAVDRVQHAASGLQERLAELDAAQRQLDATEQQLAQWTQQLLAPAAHPTGDGAASQPSEPACA